MGMKYMETIKSFALFSLIALSVLLTFVIWTYTPKYETIESVSALDISIAEKRKIENLIMPYKVVYNGEVLKGTQNELRLEELQKEMKAWDILSLQLKSEKYQVGQLKEILKTQQSMLIYYHGEVPLRAFETIYPLKDSNVSESTFDRVLITFSEKEVRMSFINRKQEYYYDAIVNVKNKEALQAFLQTWTNEMETYQAVESIESQYVATATSETTINQNIFYKEEIIPQKFRDALFTDPNAVRRSQITQQKEEYADNHAIMTVDTKNKMLNFVYPSAESNEIAIPSELLFQSVDFINEHGGWTDDFRFTYLNPITRTIKFTLFTDGLPVYGDVSGMTEILTTAGNNRMFKYVRPYYSFDKTLLIEREAVEMPAGIEILQKIKEQKKIDIERIEDVAMGYILVQDFERNLFILEPHWFYLINNQWYRYTPGREGGMRHGLG